MQNSKQWIGDLARKTPIGYTLDVRNSWAFSSSGRAPALQAGGGRFESDKVHHFILCRGSSVVEQRTENPCVGSSILPLGTTEKTIEIWGNSDFLFRGHYRFLVGIRLYKKATPFSNP